MGKKAFPCGHKGLGKFCHRCAQAAEALAIVGDKKRLEAMAKAKDTKPEELAAVLKLSAERLKSVPSKTISMVAVPNAPVAV